MTEEYRKGIKDTVDVLVEYSAINCNNCPALDICVMDRRCRQRLAEWVEKELEE